MQDFLKNIGWGEGVKIGIVYPFEFFQGRNLTQHGGVSFFK